MNVIPKFQQGGGFDSNFTRYKSIPILTPKTSAARSSKRSAKDDDDDKDDTKGKLTEKDLFSMLKEVDGLPNEMKVIMTDIMNTLQMNNLTGRGIKDIATTYVSQLYKLKIAQINKANFDAAIKTAKENGAMDEALFIDDKLVVQTDDGELHRIKLETYLDNEDKYHVITVSNGGFLRSLDSSFVNDQSFIHGIGNSIGFEKFQNLLNQAVSSLGSTTYSRNGYFSVEGAASKGLELLQTLLKDDRVLALGSVTAEGLYEYKIIDKNQLEQIKSLTTYLLQALPPSVKTWAGFKMRNANTNKATLDLILNYLCGMQTTSHEFAINYHQNKTNDKDGNDSSEEKTKEGFWRQVQAGQGGTDAPYNILIGTTTQSLTGGKYYGTTPGAETNCSLGDYLNQSGLAYLKTGKENITFGNLQISLDSYDDVMVNTRSGAYSVTLPMKNGLIWLEAVEIYEDFKKELKKSGLEPGSQAYNIKVKELLRNPSYSALSSIIQNNGELTPNNAGHFLVLEGITSSRTHGIAANGLQQNISDVNSNFIVHVKGDKNLYETVEKGLSTKERGDYKLDYDEWYDIPSWAGRYDKLYKGNIYIPLNTNPTNAANADGNQISASAARQYETMLQEWSKRNNSGLTGSNALWQQ